MLNLIQRKSRKIPKIPSFGFLLIILVWSLTMGWLLSLTMSAQGADSLKTMGTVDVVPVKYQQGQELYIQTCSSASCHIAIPPQVFPSQTWRDLLEDTQHYGVVLQPLYDPALTLVQNYLYHFSRLRLGDEKTPYRFNQSRYFKALHPHVKLPNPVQTSSCIACHPGSKDFDFRRLSLEGEQSQPEK